MRSRCAVTPSTISTVYSATGGSARPRARPARGRRPGPAGPPRRGCRGRACAPWSGRPLSRYPAEVVARAGVDLDARAGLEEQRDGDLVAGLDRRGLGAARGAVALQARLGVGDLEHDRRGELHVERRPLVHGDDRVLVLQQEVRGGADRLGRDVHLVVGVRVHEHEVRAVLVQVLHVALVDGGGVDLRPGVERPVDDLARQHVLELGTHEGAALARLDVLELHDGPQLPVEVEHQAVLQLVRRRHGSAFVLRGSRRDALAGHASAPAMSVGIARHGTGRRAVVGARSRR